MATAELPVTLTRRLHRLDRRLRRLSLIRCVSVVGVLFLSCLVAGLLVDFFADVPVALRQGWLAVTLAVPSVVLLVWLLRGVVRKRTPVQVAALIERDNPQLEERLTSTLELLDQTEPDAYRGSELMREMLVEDTVKRVAPLDFRASAPSQTARQWATAAAILLAIAILPLAVSSDWRGLWQRFFLPGANLSRISNLTFEVKPQDCTVARGSDVEVTALAKRTLAFGPLPAAGWLRRWDPKTGKALDTHVMDLSGETYSATFPHVFDSFDFDLGAGPGSTQRFHVNVVDPPECTSAKLEVQPPEYTGRPADSIDGVSGVIPVFERSRLTFSVVFNKPVKTAELVWLDFENQQNAHQAEGQDAAVASEKPTDPAPPAEPETLAARVPFKLSPDGKRGELSFDATQAGRFAVRLTDEHGLNNPEDPDRELQIVFDQQPQIRFTNHSPSQEARPDDVVTIPISAQDDVRLDKVELHYERADGTKSVLAAPVKEIQKTEAAHQFKLELSGLNLKDGDRLTYKARAVDGRPLPEPQEAWTETRTLIVNSKAKAPGTAEVALRQGQWKAALDALRADLQALENKTGEVAEAADTAGRHDKEFADAPEIPKLKEAESKLAERIEQLAARFAEHPLFGNLAEPTRDVADEAIPAAQARLDDAMAQKNLADKRDELQASQAALAEGGKTLTELSRQFDEIAQLEQDVLEFGRLAEHARELGDQLQTLDEQQQELKQLAQQGELTAAELTAKQQAIDEEIRQARADSDELQDAIARLLKQQPRLADAVRQQQNQKLKDFAAKAKALAEPQEQLADSLAREHERNQEAAGEIAGKQENALESAQQLAAGVDEAKPTGTVPPVDLATLRRALEELKQGNLAGAADQLDASASELEHLAAELERNEELPADPREAAAQLAQRQADLQQRIAKAAEDANSKSADETATAVRPLAVEQAALQAAAAKLPVPPALKDKQQQVVDNSADALDRLLAGKPEEAAQSAEQAREQLEALSKEIKPVDERRQLAQQAVENLRKDQQQVAQEAATELSKPEPNEVQLEVLRKKQAEIAAQTAELDVPGAKAEQQEAAQQTAAAAREMTPESATQAEQSLANLDDRLQGKKPGAEVAALQQKQAELAAAAAAQLKAERSPEVEKNLESLSQEQRALADAAERLNVPGARAEQAAAREALADAGSKLNGAAKDPAQTEAAEQALAKSKDALDNLAQAADPQRARQPAQRAEQLAKKLDAQAQAAEAAADAKTPRTAEQIAQAREALDGIRQQAQNLPAGTAGEEKQETLQKLADAQAKQAQAQERAAEKPENPAEAEARDAAVRDLARQEAQATEEAAQALRELAKRQQNDAAQQDARAGDSQTPEERLIAAGGQAAKLAEQQQRLHEQTADTAAGEDGEKRASESEKLAGEQQQLARAVEKLPTEAAPLARADALRQMDNARQALEEGQPDQALAAQERAAQALRDFEREAQSSARQLARDEAQPAAESPPAQQQQAARQARELAQEQRQLAEQARATAGNPMPPQQGTESGESGMPDGMGDAPLEQQIADARAAQQKLAAEAQRLAQKVSSDTGADSPASQASQESARKADAAQLNAQAGDLENAAEAAREAASAAQQAAKSVPQGTEGKDSAKPGETPAPSPSGEAGKPGAAGATPPEGGLPGQLQQLGQKLEESAQNLDAIARNSSQSQRQQAAQGDLSQQTGKVAQGLADAGKMLSEPALDAQKSGAASTRASQKAKQAEQQMEAAREQISQGRNQQAEESARDASKLLSEAAQEAEQAAGKPGQPGESPTAVPPQAADQIASAMERVRESSQALNQAEQESQTGAAKPGEASAADGMPSGEPADNGGSNEGPDSAGKPTDGSSTGKQPKGAAGKPGEQGEPGDAATQPGSESASGKPGEGSKSGMPNSGKPGEGTSGKPGPGQPGESGSGHPEGTPGAAGKPGQRGAQPGKPSALAQAAKSLQEAASAMQGVAKNASQPAGSPPDNPGGGGAGEIPGPLDETAGPDVAQLDAAVRKATGRRWGELPGKLQTEILQAASKRPGGDYARLVKLYFKQISKTHSPAGDKTE